MRQVLWIVSITAALATAPSRLAAAQWFDPDTCLTCRDKVEHLAGGVGLGLLARGPWVADSFRDAAWKRVALTTAVATGWEVIEAAQARREGKAGQSGHGISLLDITATTVGALVLEGAWHLGRKALRR